MPKFRNKPVIIDAIQFKGNFDEIENFCDGELVVATLEGANYWFETIESAFAAGVQFTNTLHCFPLFL